VFVFTQGAIWKMDSFDQWGLELFSGVSFSARIVFDGRLPSNTHCATSQFRVLSAPTCDGLFPRASGSVCVQTLALHAACLALGGFVSGWTCVAIWILRLDSRVTVNSLIPFD
jgi:hypothetical protein